MSTIIEKAKKGNRAAMNQLLEDNMPQVYGLCKMLLCNETEALNGTAQVFRQLWEHLTAGEFATEQAVTEYLTRRTVNHCKTRLLRKDSRAFQTPANKNFSAFTPSAIRPGAQGTEQLLISLPPLHRAVSVLSGGLGLSNKVVGELVGLSPELVELALAAEEGNLTRILTARQQKTGEALSLTPQQFHEALRETLSSCTLPAHADATLQADLDRVAQPLEQKVKKRNRIILGAVAACVLLAVLFFAIRGLSGPAVTFTSGGRSGSTNEGSSSATVAPVTGEFTTQMQEITCYADIEIANYGTITVALDGQSAPETVGNFVSLAESGFYDGLTFHRIMAGFMMQGGDPNGNGSGGSGVNIPGEFTSNGAANMLSHVAGAISMARASDPNSASSQFFIVHEDSTFLDGDYAVFGYVTEGMDIVDAICTSASPTDNNGTIPPDEQPVIISVTVRAADQTSTDTGSTTVVSSSGTADISIDPTTGQGIDPSEATISDETWNVAQDSTTGDNWDLSQDPSNGG